MGFGVGDLLSSKSGVPLSPEVPAQQKAAFLGSCILLAGDRRAGRHVREVAALKALTDCPCRGLERRRITLEALHDAPRGLAAPRWSALVLAERRHDVRGLP
jgi:hypothetical protein